MTSSFSPHIFIGLDLYFPHGMIHLKSLMICSALKAWLNAELIKKYSRGTMYLPTMLGGLGHYFATFVIKRMTNLSRYLAMSVFQTAPKTPWSELPSVLFNEPGRNFHTSMMTNFTLSFLSLPAFTLGVAQGATVALITLYREPSFQPFLTRESLTYKFWSHFCQYDD